MLKGLLLLRKFFCFHCGGDCLILDLTSRGVKFASEDDKVKYIFDHWIYSILLIFFFI